MRYDLPPSSSCLLELLTTVWVTIGAWFDYLVSSDDGQRDETLMFQLGSNAECRSMRLVKDDTGSRGGRKKALWQRVYQRILVLVLRGERSYSRLARLHRSIYGKQLLQTLLDQLGLNLVFWQHSQPGDRPVKKRPDRLFVIT